MPGLVNDREVRAAEYALRLLEGEELLEAQQLVERDPAFAAEVAEWQERLAPMLHGCRDTQPSPELWSRIDQALGDLDGHNVAALPRRRARLWQAAAAVAAALLAVVLTVQFASENEAPVPRSAPERPPQRAPEPARREPQPPTPAPPAGPTQTPDAPAEDARPAPAPRQPEVALPPAPPPPRTPSPVPAPRPVPTTPPLIASLTGAETGESLAVVFRRESGTLEVTPARLAPEPGRTRQLWLIPEGGRPISLGLVQVGRVNRQQLPATLAAQFVTGATIALSDEPGGGSPTGQPTGPVLATAPLAAN